MTSLILSEFNITREIHIKEANFDPSIASSKLCNTSDLIHYKKIVDEMIKCCNKLLLNLKGCQINQK